jgi:hypothetical protein
MSDRQKIILGVVAAREAQTYVPSGASYVTWDGVTAVEVGHV